MLLVGVGALLLSNGASADVRITVQRWQSICRVIITSESRHGAKLVHDGRVNSAFRKTVRGPARVCMRRSSIPDVCESPLTRWQCVTNAEANRTVQFNIR
jgi:hypothetical protein